MSSYQVLSPHSTLTPPHDTMQPHRHYKDFYFNKEGFHAEMDLHDFQAEDVTVKTSGSYIIVEAIHDERSDSFSTITRSLTRKFFIPDMYDVDSVKSVMSPYGVLTLTAKPRQKSNVEREVPIQSCGEILK